MQKLSISRKEGIIVKKIKKVTAYLYIKTQQYLYAKVWQAVFHFKYSYCRYLS